MNHAKAEEFWKQLSEFSGAYLRHLGLPFQSPWGRDALYGGASPRGAVLHYTADTELEQSLRWFCTEKYNARASSHVVVAERRLGTAERFLPLFPLIDELPVTVVQVRPPLSMAWHATWLNGFAYGIENTNAGELRKDPATGKLMHWRPLKDGMPEWTTPWASILKSPVEAAGRTWDNFPESQVRTNVILLRYLNALCGGSLQAPWILGHEQAQGIDTLKDDGSKMRTQKRDPGPLFPLNDIRRAVLSQDPDDSGWLRRYDAQPSYCDRERDSYVVDAVESLAGSRPSPEVAWQRFDAAVRVLPERPEFGVIGKLALKLLGYHVTALLVPELDSDDLQSVLVFQKLMGLKPDSQPGRNTKNALVARLVDRGLLRDFQKV